MYELLILNNIYNTANSARFAVSPSLSTRGIPHCSLAIAVQVVYYSFVLLTHRLLFTTTVYRSFPWTTPEDLLLVNADEHGAFRSRNIFGIMLAARKENCSLFQILPFLATFNLLPVGFDAIYVCLFYGCMS